MRWIKNWTGTAPECPSRRNHTTTGADDDDVPEPLAEPVSHTGDLWTPGGGHRLLCGDSASATDVARVMKGEAAALCFTLPPYGQQRDYADGASPFRKARRADGRGRVQKALAYMVYPKDLRTKLHSATPLERRNGEIKRRTNVVGIFSGESAATRLIGRRCWISGTSGRSVDAT